MRTKYKPHDIDKMTIKEIEKLYRDIDNGKALVVVHSTFPMPNYNINIGDKNE